MRTATLTGFIALALTVAHAPEAFARGSGVHAARASDQGANVHTVAGRGAKGRLGRSKGSYGSHHSVRANRGGRSGQANRGQGSRRGSGVQRGNSGRRGSGVQRGNSGRRGSGVQRGNSGRRGSGAQRGNSGRRGSGAQRGNSGQRRHAAPHRGHSSPRFNHRREGHRSHGSRRHYSPRRYDYYPNRHRSHRHYSYGSHYYYPKRYYYPSHYSYGYSSHRYRYRYSYGYYNYCPTRYYKSYSYGYSPAYAASYCYGYYPFSYGKYYGVGTYYSGYGSRAYAVPIVLDPITTGGSYAYSQSPSGVEEYRDWQREEDQLAHERELDFAQDQLMVEAWDLLSAGEGRAALRSFTRLCERYPEMASSKAGYAIAAALVGDQRTAFWAMRRAVMTGDGMLGYLPDPAGAAPVLDQLALNLRGDLEERGPSSERLFLLAGFEMLRHDEDAALQLARDAYNAGARHESLLRMLAYLESRGVPAGLSPPAPFGPPVEPASGASLKASAVPANH